jgi:pyruvate,water dikinase
VSLSFEELAQRAGWLYTRSIEYEGWIFVHMPLVYATRVDAELAAYARALGRFPYLCAYGGTFPFEVLHDVVAVCDPTAVRTFAAWCLDELRLDDALARRWVRHAARLLVALPESCIAFEARLLDSVKAEEELRHACEIVTDAIALNLANPFVELHASEQAVQLTSEFSSDRWFHERLDTLRARVARGSAIWTDFVDFAWEAGFLPRRDGQRALWQDPSRVAEALGWTGARGTVRLKPRRPDLGTLPSTDAFEPASLLRLFGYLEEFRHYWQTRLFARVPPDPAKPASIACPASTRLRAQATRPRLTTTKTTPPKAAGLVRLQDLSLDVPPFAVVEWVDGPAVRDALRSLGESPDGLSVRSAAPAEDAASSSMAGRFLSFNGVDEEEVEPAARVIVEHHRRTTGGDCAVILQHTFAGYLSGVAFLEEDMVVIEATFGSCRNIVDGSVVPYRSTHRAGAWTHDFAPNDTECAVFTCAAGCFETPCSPLEPGAPLVSRMQPFPERPRLLLVPVTREWYVYGHRPSAPPAWYETRIANRFLDLAPLLPHSDVEWSADAAGRLVFLQARPITAPLPRGEAPPPEEPALRGICGIPASPGRFRGPIVRPGAPHTQCDVLMLTQVSEVEYDEMARCGAVLASMGGRLSHIAILCRELQIPCITGLGTLLSAGTIVELDGATGVVRIAS